MTNELTFQDHVENLSAPLRRQHDLVMEVLSDGDVVLKNDVIRFRFFPGWPKDPYLHVSVSYADPTVLGKETYFEFWRYINFNDAWVSFPSTWDWDGARLTRVRGGPYSFIGSPYQVLEALAFLGSHGARLFEPDREHIREFMAWVDEENRRYSERVSRRT